VSDRACFRSWYIATRRGRGAAVGAFFLTALSIGRAHADDPDPLFGRDKALHFAVSASIAGAGYGVTTAFAKERWKALIIGGGAAIAAGALKEGYDAAGHGDPSWKDFGWDVVGAAVGLALAWGIDVAVHGGETPPLSSRLSLDPSAPSSAFALHF
jgi:putative lipoprotein